jgi:hypothetical protein
LVNEAVYQYDKIGLRFLTPQGWWITSRATLPPGALPKPMKLVAYHLKNVEHPAALEVLTADLPDDTDLGQYLLKDRVGQGEWTIQAPAETIAINGVPATRLTLSHRQGSNEDLRETTIFRRGGRCYFFILSFDATDNSARDTGRKSIESVVWTQP